MLPVPLLLALTACTDGGGFGRRDVAKYDISLLVRYPKNQSPLESADRLELVLDHAEGDPDIYELSSVDNPQLEGLGDLSDTRVLLRAFEGDALLAYGVTTPLTAHDEEIEQTLLVAEVDRMAWLESTGEGRGLGALVSDGLGSFYLFGGDAENPGDFDGETSPGFKSDAQASIWRLDIAPPDALSFEPIETEMPSFVGSGDGEEHDGRVSHSATLLTGNAKDSGLILVAGGAAMGNDWTSASYHAFLFDPATEELIDIGDDPMRSARFAHQAVEHVSGDVFLIGGWTRAAEGSIVASDSWEVYKRDSQDFEIGQGSLGGGPYAAASSLGSAGVLVCGGIDISAQGFNSTSGCAVLQPSGASEVIDSPQGLSFSHHAMASLGSGKVLMAGGIRGSGLEQYEEASAIDEAWIYDAASGSWSRTADMGIGRANHAMVPLPDGRVLVVGGSTSIDLMTGLDALACAEIFDPDKGDNGQFEVLDSCTDDSNSASLPTPVYWPMLAIDEDYGVLVAGGFGADHDADNNASLWLPKPAEEFE